MVLGPALPRVHSSAPVSSINHHTPSHPIPCHAQIAIEPKRPNESMKAFQHRVRQERSALLRASNVANSATQQRRREYLRQRKQEKKLRKKKHKGTLTYEEVEEQLAEERERVLLGGGEPSVGFGETNDAPPDLRALGLGLPRLRLGGNKSKQAEDGSEDASQQRRPQQPPKAQHKAKQPKGSKPARTTAEKAEWAQLREQAQEAYRAMRAKQSQGPRL